MTVELGGKTPDVPEEAEEQRLEKLWAAAAKELRLPVGVRRRIRRLKEQGMRKEADGYRIGEVEKAIKKRKARTKMQKAEEMLDKTVKQIVESDDLGEEGESMMRATWLSDLVGDITPQERTADLHQILEEYPELESELPGIRDEVLGIEA